MGIDISGVFQARDREGWTSLRTYDQGLRGLLRYWLGWGAGGWYAGDFGVKPLVGAPRGLPDDFEQSADTYVIRNLRTRDAIGTNSQNWLGGEEILTALPVLGRRTVVVPQAIVRELTERNASPEQWKPIVSEMDSLVDSSIRLVKVSPKWEASHPSGAGVHVDCLFDFSDREIQDFADEVAELRRVHQCVRFVYGFE